MVVGVGVGVMMMMMMMMHPVFDYCFAKKQPQATAAMKCKRGLLVAAPMQGGCCSAVLLPACSVNAGGSAMEWGVAVAASANLFICEAKGPG